MIRKTNRGVIEPEGDRRYACPDDPGRYDRSISPGQDTPICGTAAIPRRGDRGERDCSYPS
jgi:hypothetical protein